MVQDSIRFNELMNEEDYEDVEDDEEEEEEEEEEEAEGETIKVMVPSEPPVKIICEKRVIVSARCTCSILNKYLMKHFGVCLEQEKQNGNTIRSISKIDENRWAIYISWIDQGPRIVTMICRGRITIEVLVSDAINELDGLDDYPEQEDDLFI
ncbi:hypothetical protein BDB01DRAFT_835012 [Pilobolus umbonatus]|nr:hypothetical protein BDB01DRAFT_835012 [Pilobolus umbonatus]